MNQRGFLVLLVAAVLVLAVFVLAARAPAPAPPDGPCSDTLDRAALETSLELGTSFLLAHQNEAGNFTYEYNWRDGTFTPKDSAVRQAGATWGLALIFLERPTAEIHARLDRALQFFRQHSAINSNGRFVRYPGDRLGSLGTVALVALAHVEYLRSDSELVTPERRAELEADLDAYIQYLLSMKMPEGLFRSRYIHVNGGGYSDPSPYYDGETMLALAKAARYLGRDDLWPVVLAAAKAGRERYIVEARAEDPDSDLTKGFYQWSSMTFFELATSDLPDVDAFGDTLIELADWMIDTHRTLERTRNTAYAYEGIIHAYELARRRGLDDKARKLRCTIEIGLEKLTSWQVGHPSANAYIQEEPTDDPRAIGGIQNHRREPQQRIDVAQHQMHAVILALRYVFP